MKILFISHYKWPHVGGVEKHVYELSKRLKVKGNGIKVISEEDIKQPHIKFLGLIYVWFWMFRNRKLIEDADIVHCHDVFIWYLPFRFLYPKKPVYTTFHGWEGIWPIPWKNIFLKKLAAKLSWGSIAVGKYIEKYYGIKVNKIIYGGTLILHSIKVEIGKTSIVFVGRLEKDTGILGFLKWLNKNPKHVVDFVGDGVLREKCEKYGTIHGFTDPTPFYKQAKYCVPGGYLAALEASSYGCELKLFWNNKIKRDYWKMSPFIGKDVVAWAKKQTWNKLADEYLNLYNSI
ncbi:MAG: glycosyl transferase, group 1 family protein [uncultured bacterium]|uniref:Glycosyltransferase, group 1 family protein n=1 Tax=Candidatus Woesebacteria bacterium GW2011_GWA1_40_43 TaxID=1618553 RepID=A0A0G0SIH7_9BACT|nr:MAG: glycosyl transferase, group 1 family protein [uncultured bacterium]KKR52872.1 MAG: Glycosyltransferase, group 1 family protein [Candidatus Woesebacteria bacterium GW2011_GWD2_40_19]KKR58375.1 MAG: Glycosyltransferase, group 1 family protein [Candidatus Woesebacteria bacterium GW2011_GWC2_40_30]KKR64599.1 MAG: Glycosyltransferase, group 1 family protein [Candidatus Woesebacteria bacterium GW2011_GWA1_40_43]HAU65403.1 hypothetical protein [Candidatus Woesebacteria bacterium]